MGFNKREKEREKKKRYRIVGRKGLQRSVLRSYRSKGNELNRKCPIDIIAHVSMRCVLRQITDRKIVLLPYVPSSVKRSSRIVRHESRNHLGQTATYYVSKRNE